MARRGRIDTVLAMLIAVLLIGGCFVFASAAFGLLARGTTTIGSVVFNHLVLGVGLGGALLFIAAFLDYRYWRKYAPYLFAFALCATALVFVPGIGAEHGGGKRWIIVFGKSFQPSELLKLATLVMTAAYFTAMRSKVSQLGWGAGGYVGIILLPTLLLVMQPDMGTLGVIVISSFAIYFAAGARVRDVVLLATVGIILLGLLISVRPYARDRVITFLNPSHGTHQESYQIRQSLIAIGSGELTGRGFGQGVQKFTYLPEPMGDSIFAVASEELGFVGSATIVLLFLALTLRGFSVATRVTEPFGKFLAIGIATYLGVEACINIASMLGIAPLTGIPLTFVSQGGSAMLISLLSAGILLGISRSRAARHA